MSKGRGGLRIGSGAKSQWKNGKTKTIRVPIVIAEQVLEIARGLDEGKRFILEQEQNLSPIIDYDTVPKVIDLSGVSIRQTNGIISVYLEDLAKVGYQFKPDRLSQLVEARLQKLELDRKFRHGNH